MLPICGKPLLIQMIERVKKSELKGQIVVATTTNLEDDIVVEMCVNHGIEVFRGHPTNLLDRHYQVAKKYYADVLLKIPSDCPLIDPNIIDKVISEFLQNNTSFDYGSNLHPATYPDGNDVEIMTFTALEEAWTNAVLPHHQEHTTPYIYENPQMFKLLNIFWETGMDYSNSHRWTIDYQEDYEFIKQVYENLYPYNNNFELLDILNLVESKPELMYINQKYVGHFWWKNTN